MPLLISKNYDLCFVVSAQSHLVQNGDTREVGMAAELWCHAEESCELEGLGSHWFSPGRSTGFALAGLGGTPPVPSRGEDAAHVSEQYQLNYSVLVKLEIWFQCGC